MSTTILLLPAEITYAASIMAEIAAVDPTITTNALVVAGAVTVGLNRLLSQYTTTADQLTAILASHLDASASSLTITASAFDVGRISAIVSFTHGAATTVDVTGCAARTGLAMLAGGDASLPPLRTS